MIEMYQNGELGEMIEKAKADMIQKIDFTTLSLVALYTIPALAAVREKRE